jgi:hypothetical protein
LPGSGASTGTSVEYKWALNTWGNDCIPPDNPNSTNNNRFTVYLGSDRSNLGVICNCDGLSESDLTSDSCFCNSTSLASGHTYYWSVEADNGALNSFSDIWNFHVCSQSSAPSAPRLSSPSDGAIIHTPFALLTWDNSPANQSWGSTCCANGTICDASGWSACCPQRRYWVHYDTSGANTPAIAGLDASQNTYNALISGPDIPHAWKVCADNGSGQLCTPSSVWYFTPENKAPDAANLTVPAPGGYVNSTTTSFRWTHGDDDINWGANLNPGSNLLSNGSFENIDASGWPLGWIRSGDINPNSSSINCQADPPSCAEGQRYFAASRLDDGIDPLDAIPQKSLLSP